MDGEIDLAPERLYAIAHGLPLPATGEDVEANEQEMSLRELRKLAGVSQAELAGTMGQHQGELSRFERRGNFHIHTLRRYVEALGGQLELVATIGNKRVVIRG